MMTPIELVELVALELAELLPEVVFVEGAITGALFTDLAARSISSTKDVDAIVSVTTRANYLDRLGTRMKARGFKKMTRTRQCVDGECVRASSST